MRSLMVVLCAVFFGPACSEPPSSSWRPCELDGTCTSSPGVTSISAASACLLGDVPTCADPSAPICEAGACRACSGPNDDAACALRTPSTPHCETSGARSGRCVACRSTAPRSESLDCGAAAPVCDDTGTCRTCAANRECASGVCIRDGANAGQCALAAEVALVDNRGKAADACRADHPIRDGKSLATAYCELEEATTDNWAFVRVAGRYYPYDAVKLVDRPITIVGPGPDAVPTARIATVGAVSITIWENIGTHLVVLDGLDLGGTPYELPMGAVAYRNYDDPMYASSLVIRDTWIHHLAGPGIACDGGDVHLQRLVVEEVHGIGVWMTGTAKLLEIDQSSFHTNYQIPIHVSAHTYAITNNLIHNNITFDNSAVVLAGGTGTFRFNTIAGNAGSGTVAGGGVRCEDPSGALLSDSIIAMNRPFAGSQVGSHCTLSNVVTGPDSAPGAITLSPVFVSNVDFHLVLHDPANEACCVDKVDTGPILDVDGEHRAKGARFDIGADEIE